MQGPDEEMAEMVYELQNMVEIVKTMVLEGEIQATDWNHAEIDEGGQKVSIAEIDCCLLYTSPSPRDLVISRMPSSA